MIIFPPVKFSSEIWNGKRSTKMPPTEATIPLTDGNRIVKPPVTIVSKEANRRQSLMQEDATVPDATMPNENGKLSDEQQRQQQQHLSWLGRLSYHVSITIGQFFYRWVNHIPTYTFIVFFCLAWQSASLNQWRSFVIFQDLWRELLVERNAHSILNKTEQLIDSDLRVSWSMWLSLLCMGL